MAPAKILLYTGAPRSTALDWNHPGLLNNFSDPFCRFSGRGSGQDTAHPAPGSAAGPLYPSWRSISLDRQHLITGHSQDHGPHGASFFTVSAVGSFIKDLSPTAEDVGQSASSESAELVLSQFYEQSYARHNDVMSSQLAALSDTENASHSTQDSWDASRLSAGFPPETVSRAMEVPLSGNLNDLKDTPNASYLDSIHPQTMTVNLIVGIISVLPPRAVQTRHRTGVQLIEVLVGDETKSGFGISFWISGSQSVRSDMESVLGRLRPQDVVLMRNIALNSFRGKVYGQSLRKGLTKIHLLYRTRIDRTDPSGCYSAADLASATGFDSQIGNQIMKTVRVREWSLKFVRGGDVKSDTNNRVSLTKRDALPPDTQ